MRDKHYKNYSYRLNEITVKELKKLRKNSKSYNLLFQDLIKLKKEKDKKNKKKNG